MNNNTNTNNNTTGNNNTTTKKNAKSKLTCVEIACLWNSYLFESMLHHIFCYFINTTEDKDIKKFIEYCKVTTSLHAHSYMGVFQKEKLPIPRGTTSEDININAPKLFSDAFYITYIKNMAKFALTNSALAYSECSNIEVRMLYKEQLDRLEEVDKMATEIMKSKKIYVTPPSVELPTQIDFINDKKKFYGGAFVDKRPLSVLEVRQLFINIQSNTVEDSLMQGFIQIASSEDIIKYLEKGKELYYKHLDTFCNAFSEESLPLPPSYAQEVLQVNKDQSPFSERLLLNHTMLLIALGISNYALGIAQSQRKDLMNMYGKIITEMGSYADKGAEILIKNKWLEQPPLLIGNNNQQNN